jgi:CMP-N,N'-diacetyllegionaminic acid synthase
MINGKSVIAIIPARGGSKGLPGKNILNLCGRPLLGWPIRTVKNSMYVDRVIVSTDDKKIAIIAKDQGAEVPFLRPPELALDTSTTISVLEHAIAFTKREGLNYDYCLLLEPTSPLTESSDVDEALEKLDSNRDIADSIVGVSKVEATHPAFDVVINRNGLIGPYLADDFSKAGRRQEIEALYFLEGSLYISDTTALTEKRKFYHSRTLPCIVPKWKAFEVDDIVDFICIEAILSNINKIKDTKSIF